jgi:hypothetical protein
VLDLEKEIELSIDEIKTDSYSMSIGEIANLYAEGDLDIFPEYQRYFRWNINQKSDLIESIILGIPIPPIFVAQEKSGKWDVIDGLQRISTILEFMGILKKKDKNELYEPSKLIRTKFLPSLEGKQWDNKSNVANSLTVDIRRKFKRRKLDLIIIDSTVNPKAKYEMFQRLNTNGSQLTDQEVRNCLMIMVNTDYFKIVNKLSNDAIFKKITALTDRNKQQQYDKELIIRYIISRSVNLNEIKNQDEMATYLTEELINLMESNQIDLGKYSNDFIETVKILDNVLGEKVFNKYNNEKEAFEGGFSLSMYEVLMVGLCENRSLWVHEKNKLVQLIKDITSNSKFLHATQRGKKPLLRFKELNLLSRELFGNED